MIDNYHSIHLNSDNLKRKHKYIYDDFFAKNSLVLSCPSVLLWSPTYSAGRGGAVLVNKLPARIYIGLRKGNKKQNKNIIFKNFSSYYPEQNKFKTTEEVLPFWNSRAGKIINHFLKKDKINDYIEVSVLSEAPISRGWHTTQVICSALTFAVYLYLGKISTVELRKFVEMPTEDLIKNKKFNEILKTAWKVASYSEGVFDDGYALASALVNSYYPIIYYHEKDPMHWDQYKDDGFDNQDSYYNLGDRINYRMVRMEELFNLSSYPEWAFNFGIIHIGKECSLVHIYNSQYYRKNQFEETVKFIKANFKDDSYFLKLCENKDTVSGWMSVFQNYRMSSVVLSLEFLRCFYNLAKFGYQEDHLREFFRLTNLCQNIQNFISPPAQLMDEVCAIFNHRGHKVNELGIGVKMISQGVQGDILLAAPLSDFEKVFQSAISDLGKVVKGSICCEYISKCDGLEKEGIKVEQYLEKNIYSSFISNSSLVLKILDEKNKLHSQIITKEELEKDIKNYDVLGDLTHKKIYIRGHLLSSKDIHSTKVTLEVLNKFFEKQEPELFSLDFNPSSYTKDRNLMESKITRPFVAAFRKRVKKNLDFKVKGGLGSRFEVIFRPDSFRIGMVQ